jgi:carboxypeptidase T
LTEEGRQRAEQLRDILAPLRVTAVYSTDTNRTRQTAQPTAAALDLDVLLYERPSSQQCRRWLEQHRNANVLIVGHSNTVGDIVNGLGVPGDFQIGNTYDHLFVVSVTEERATVVVLRYGEPSGTAQRVMRSVDGSPIQRLVASESQKEYHFYSIDYRTDASKRLIHLSGLDVLQKEPGRRRVLVRATRDRIEKWRSAPLPADIVISERADLDRSFDAEVKAFRESFEAREDPAGLYHTYAEVASVLGELAADNPMVNTDVIGNSVLGKSIHAIEIGTGETEFIVVGCHHAREWISVEVPLELARFLATPALQGAHRAQVAELLEQAKITIIPMLNPDGHDLSASYPAQRLWRKNIADNGDGTFGVDLNRNYSVHWGGTGSSGYTSDQTYRGPYAFSEPETCAFRDFVMDRAAEGKLKGVLSYHSYSQLVLYPWGREPDTSDPYEESRRRELAEAAELYSAEVYAVHAEDYQPMQSVELYPASGIMGDWVWGTLTYEVPTLTVELRPRAYSGSSGFILPESMIEPTWNENRPAILAVFSSWLPEDVVPPPLSERRSPVVAPLMPLDNTTMRSRLRAMERRIQRLERQLQTTERRR